MKCIKFFKINNYGKISFRQNLPLKIELNVGKMSNLTFYIAPLIDDEDTDTDDSSL